MQWIKNNSRENTYNDPFKGTPKEAKTATKTAKIKTSFTNYAVYRDSVRYAQNRENGWGNTSQAEINWWKTKGMGDSRNRKGNLIENKQYKNNTNMKQRIKLTESDLHRIIKESVKRVLKESQFSEEQIHEWYMSAAKELGYDDFIVTMWVYYFSKHLDTAEQMLDAVNDSTNTPFPDVF